MGIDSILGGARDWVGDRLDDVDAAKQWVGHKIDDGVHGAEGAVDGFRKDMVAFGEEHGGIVGKTIAQFASDQIGLTEGAVLATYDMGKGVVQVADSLGKVTNPLEWATHADRNFERVTTAAKAGVALGSLASPIGWAVNGEGNVQTAKALWNGVTAGYQDAAKDGDWSKFGGRLVVDVGSLFVGAGEVNAATKTARATSALGEVADAGKVLDLAPKAIEAAPQRLAIEAAPQRLAIEAAPERLALEGPPKRLAIEAPPSAATIAARQDVARAFYGRFGKVDDSHLAGIDFTRPVEVVTVPKDTVVYQFQAPGSPQGSYYAPSAVAKPTDLGIFDKGVTPEAFGRVREIQGRGNLAEVAPSALRDKALTPYVVKEDTQVLVSTAKSVTDTWSIPDRTAWLPTDGGRTQFFNPDRSLFQPVK